jgi:hypothetical protein
MGKDSRLIISCYVSYRKSKRLFEGGVFRDLLFFLAFAGVFHPVFHRFEGVAAGFHGIVGQHGGVVAVDFYGFGGTFQVAVIFAVGDGAFDVCFHRVTSSPGKSRWLGLRARFLQEVR